MKQQRSKYYQQAKDGKYTLMCKTEAAAEAEQNKQETRTQALGAIIDRLNVEFPHVQPTLRATTSTLQTRMV